MNVDAYRARLETLRQLSGLGELSASGRPQTRGAREISKLILSARKSLANGEPLYAKILTVTARARANEMATFPRHPVERRFASKIIDVVIPELEAEIKRTELGRLLGFNGVSSCTRVSFSARAIRPT